MNTVWLWDIKRPWLFGKPFLRIVFEQPLRALNKIKCGFVSFCLFWNIFVGHRGLNCQDIPRLRPKLDQALSWTCQEKLPWQGKNWVFTRPFFSAGLRRSQQVLAGLGRSRQVSTGLNMSRKFQHFQNVASLSRVSVLVSAESQVSDCWDLQA
jgi:hypothetical protein